MEKVNLNKDFYKITEIATMTGKSYGYVAQQARLGVEIDGDNYNIYYDLPEYQIVNIPSYIRGAIDSSFQGFEALTEEQQRKVISWAFEFSITPETSR